MKISVFSKVALMMIALLAVSLILTSCSYRVSQYDRCPAFSKSAPAQMEKNNRNG